MAADSIIRHTRLERRASVPSRGAAMPFFEEIAKRRKVEAGKIFGRGEIAPGKIPRT